MIGEIKKFIVISFPSLIKAILGMHHGSLKLWHNFFLFWQHWMERSGFLLGYKSLPLNALFDS
jgi:hypothetical protein